MPLQLQKDDLIHAIESGLGFVIHRVAQGDLQNMSSMAVAANLLPKNGTFAANVAQHDVFVARNTNAQNRTDAYIYLLRSQSDGHGWYVKQICCAQPARGNGVGSLLFLAAFKSILEVDIPVTLVVHDQHKSAASLYKRLGFQLSSTYPNDFSSEESGVNNGEEGLYKYYKLSDAGKGLRTCKSVMKAKIKGTLKANPGKVKQRALEVLFNFQGATSATFKFNTSIVNYDCRDVDCPNTELILTGFKNFKRDSTNTQTSIPCNFVKAT